MRSRARLSLADCVPKCRSRVPVRGGRLPECNRLFDWDAARFRSGERELLRRGLNPDEHKIHSESQPIERVAADLPIPAGAAIVAKCEYRRQQGHLQVLTVGVGSTPALPD